MGLLKTLAKAGCEDILLMLLEKEELNFGKIANLTKHRPTATRALKELTRAGLLERKVLEDRSVRYRLTEKGKAVSKIIKELREIEDAF
ncbi:MAG: winged helix-turn-helix transcriptional regulator [Candidatus Methanospirareceae archaeon]